MFYGLFLVGSDADGNDIYISRVYNGSNWTVCNANTYSKTKDSFSRIVSATYNGGIVLFDDGTQPSVTKSSTSYQPPYTGAIVYSCGGGGGFQGYSYGGNDSWYAIYWCNTCQKQFSSEAGNGPTEQHGDYATHYWHEIATLPATAATRSYSISWKNQLSTVTLAETSMNSNSYSTKKFDACLFSQNGTNDSIITINPDNTVEIQWFATGIDSGYCDKTWTF